MAEVMQDDAEPGAGEIEALLRGAGLVPPGSTPRFRALTGGVASDIWKVDAGDAPFVVKRALPKLRVAADWCAPVSRNQSEVGWLKVAKSIVPNAVPDVLFHDAGAGLFAMTFFPPESHPVWKAQLRDGLVDAAFAAEVGRTIARIHAGTAGDAAIARLFANDATFHAIRLEPYLEATVPRHPALSDTLLALSRATLGRHIALVHGDVSPKNILAGPNGPVFLDAECAWYGDPAFDVAFCLNHLLLKGLWNRAAAERLLMAFDALASAYLAGATFEPSEPLEARIAALLPALLLARIDGKSPVEYLIEDRDREFARSVAIPLVLSPPPRLRDIGAAWGSALGSRQ